LRVERNRDGGIRHDSNLRSFYGKKLLVATPRERAAPPRALSPPDEQEKSKVKSPTRKTDVLGTQILSRGLPPGHPPRLKI